MTTSGALEVILDPPPRLWAVGWDLDSTLASTVHRRHLIPDIKAGKATWDDYSDLCPDDEPIAGAVMLARMLYRGGYAQYAISGRSERARCRTSSWLSCHGVPMDHLVLRPEGDRTETEVFKVAQIRELQAQGVQFCLFIEDWAVAAEYISKETGIPVLGVNPFDPDTMLVSRDALAVVLDEIGKGAGIWPSRDRASELAAEIFPRLGGAF